MSNPPPNCGLKNGQSSTGVFYYSAANGLRDITDGSSNTIAFSEGVAGTNGNIPAQYATGVNIAGQSGQYDANTNIPQLQTSLQACTNAWVTATPGAGLSTNRGQYWANGAEANSMFSTIVTPSSTQYKWGHCRFGCETCPAASADHSHITNANSYHPGGANVALADGSVKFIKSTIALSTYWALGTKAHGEVISADAY